MTEDQAKTKWCPMVRFSIGEDDNNSCNNRDISGDVTKCIGSDCMMWRMKYVEQQDERNVSVLMPDYYCGLAGKP
jgi:hypothetical protein